jgi:hypothetical protein
VSAPYIPDVGDTFEVTRTWVYRKWQWTPFPRYRTRVSSATHSYRVDAWLRRRRPRPESCDERAALTRQIIDEMIAEGQIDPPRGAGPDNVPLEWCRREEAEYVSGVGVAGIIVRVADVEVTGQVPWDKGLIQYARISANRLAGEPLT